MISHETACLLNTTDREARVEITMFFADLSPRVRTACWSQPGGRVTCSIHVKRPTP